MPHRYRVYGLTVASEIVCPTLTQEPDAQRATDVTVTSGKPRTTHAWQRYYLKTCGETLLMNIIGVAAFTVSNGCHISIHPHVDHDPDMLQLYLLGFVFGMLLHQRGYCVLHCNAIVNDQHTVSIFMGDSGAGKSTTAAAFCQQGYRFLTDDVAAIYLQDQQPWVAPSFPDIKLCHDAVEKLTLTDHNLKPIAHREEKVFFHPTQQFVDHPCRLANAYLLDRSEHYTQPKKIRLQGAKALETLLYNTYRHSMLRRAGLAEQQFHQLSQLSQYIAVYHLQLPLTLRPNDIVEWLIKHDF